MSTDQVAADLRQAVDERLAARIAQAQQRRAAREKARRDKQARRDAGLRKRHARKLARNATHGEAT